MNIIMKLNHLTYAKAQYFYKPTEPYITLKLSIWKKPSIMAENWLNWVVQVEFHIKRGGELIRIKRQESNLLSSRKNTTL